MGCHAQVGGASNEPVRIESSELYCLALRHSSVSFMGEIRARCRAVGRPISPQDAWIVATALQHHLPLVTHNPADFEVIEELELITTVR